MGTFMKRKIVLDYPQLYMKIDDLVFVSTCTALFRGTEKNNIVEYARRPSYDFRKTQYFSLHKVDD